MNSIRMISRFLSSGAGAWVSGILAIIALSEAGFTFSQIQKISTELAESRSALTELSASDSAVIANLRTLLANERSENAGLGARLLDQVQQTGALQSQVQIISTQVGTLQKLATTDKQLLEKYSKVYFLNENYSPSAVGDIPAQYDSNPKIEELFHAQALPFLLRMLDAANAANAPLRVVSAYRSFGTQSSLKAAYKMTYGAGTANQFSADQGYSEHQLGTAVDLATPAEANTLTTSFDGSAGSKWLVANAYKYGFELSYPKNNKYYEYEPWHWRFVGIALATKLHAEGKNFYDLDQREIDTYLVSLFDN